MAYIVFARKWRPRGFDDMVGQEHIVSTLRRSIEKDRVAHAYIFTGTRGVGKTTAARILARALNCEKGPTADPCGECDTCKDILGGASFDVMEIDGASNNSVDDIRELRSNIGHAAMGGRYRVIVIDEVHMLSKSAFNALLKTLEEPPRGLIFILATTEPHKIPATIHSRCQRYDFRRVSAERLAAHLAKICESENISFEKSALTLVARKAEGSVRDSLSLLDQVCSFCGDALTEKEVRGVLGLVGTDTYRELMKNIREKNQAAALDAVQKTLFDGYELSEFIDGLQEHLRNLLFSRIPGALESRGVDLEPDDAKTYAEEARDFTETDLLRMTEIVKRAENELGRSAYPRFLVEVMIFKLLRLDSTVSIEQLLKFVADGTDGPLHNEDVKKKPDVTAPIHSPAPTRTHGIDPETPPPQSSRPNTSPPPQKIPAQTPAATSANSSADFKDAVKEEPMIQALMDMFDGKLI